MISTNGVVKRESSKYSPAAVFVAEKGSPKNRPSVLREDAEEREKPEDEAED